MEEEKAIQGPQGPIAQFTGPYKFLSNFYPTIVPMGGVDYPTVEHAYQAAKTFNRLERVLILAQPTAGKAKMCGRRVTMRTDWERVKLPVMESLLRHKFSNHHPQILRQLIETGERELIEGNNWGDMFWGVELTNGRWDNGENHLGKLLMKIRSEL